MQSGLYVLARGDGDLPLPKPVRSEIPDQAVAQRNVAALESRAANNQCTAAFSNAPVAAPATVTNSVTEVALWETQETRQVAPRSIGGVHPTAHNCTH
jgi:hypothetical protein